MIRALALGMLVAAGALAQGRDFSKVEIKSVHVAGNVWMLIGAGGNIGLSVGDDGVAMIDDQFAPLSPKLHAAIAKLSPKPVRFLINTHWHFDHTGGNALFADTATIFAQENVRKRMLVGAKTAKWEVAPAEPKALPIVTFEQGLSLWWNGEEIRAIHLQPGHTDGDTVIVFTKSNVVHMGDDFMTIGFPIIDLDSGGSVRGLVGALDTLIPQIPPGAKIIPGHGDAVATVDDLRKFRSTLDEMVEVVRRGLAAGKSVQQLQQEHALAPWEPAWGKGYVKAEEFIAIIARDLARK